MTNEAGGRKPPSLGDTRPADIRAAAMLRESGWMSFDTGIEAALAAAAAEMSVGRSEVIRLAVREWLETRQRESDRSAKPDQSGTERAGADA
ncbi:hypothetical protein P9272_29635 [Mesorhizobium sp. WSM4976]|uniref:hypothetical protein n=1 Tax=Mesorhizobium sp. WSM4976 TaxID=3038549 RepID=UPI002416FC73|nr:hypothetical protein [Mesorhizobium sp. WSM4976]MDG4897704.1 hypothetical protein [Mesorhizobium sp. WSM4976]